ncbi:hypothetical protein Y032_0135g1900 [Ancylostoma ceylanicum]|uniref:Uncharacterized protein n=1 Tax=Ancylostoma ceylanicum TaxID=53326 RepID=A0A016T4L3_9BILA|nr:hypothetical protein Y032_0135g1900 [Ancylostoma ceylanicum]
MNSQLNDYLSETLICSMLRFFARSIVTRLLKHSIEREYSETGKKKQENNCSPADSGAKDTKKLSKGQNGTTLQKPTFKRLKPQQND